MFSLLGSESVCRVTLEGARSYHQLREGLIEPKIIKV